MANQSGSIAQANGTGEAAPTPYDLPPSSAQLPNFPPQPDLSSSSLPLPFPFPLFASGTPSASTAELPTPPPVASTSTAPPAAATATDQPFPGFPKVSEFDQQRVGYLDSLDQKKKRAKALVDTELYNFVRSTLLYPQDTSLRTAQDRFWARATFTLARKGEEPNSASAAAKVLTSLSAAKPPSPPPPTVDAEGDTPASTVGDYLVDFSAQPVASTSAAPPPPPSEPAASTSTTSSAGPSTAKPPRTSRRPGRPAVSTPSFLPLLTDSSGAPIPVDESTVVVIHDRLPVAKSEEIFGILVECHRKVEHGGREKTFKEVRTKWAWVPKELVARFIKICPTCIANSTPGIKWRNQTTKKSTGTDGSGEAKKSAGEKGKKAARGKGKGKGKGKAKEDQYEDGDEEGGGGEEDAEGESDDEEDLAVGEHDDLLVDPAADRHPPSAGGRIGTRASSAAAGAVLEATSPSGGRPAKKVKVETRRPSKRLAANGTGDAAKPLSSPGPVQQPLPPPPPPAHPSTYYPSPLSTAALPLPLQASPPSATPAHLPHPYSSSHSTIPSSTPAHPFYTPYQPFATGSLPTSAPSFPLGLQHPAYSSYSPSSLHPQLQQPPPSSSAYTSPGLPFPPSGTTNHTSYPFSAYPQHPFPSAPPIQQQHQQQPSANANVVDGSASASLEDVLRAAEHAQAWAAANPSLLAGAAAGLPGPGDGASTGTTGDGGIGGVGGRKRGRVEALGEREG